MPNDDITHPIPDLTGWVVGEVGCGLLIGVINYWKRWELGLKLVVFCFFILAGTSLRAKFSSIAPCITDRFGGDGD